MPLAAHLLTQHLSLGGRVQGPEDAQLIAQQPLSQTVHDLTRVPGPFVIAEIEYLLHEPGDLPPLHQVPEQRGLARAAHALDEQHIAYLTLTGGHQPSLDLQHIQIPAHKTISRLGRMIEPALLLPVFLLLRCSEIPQAQCRLGPGSAVLVDHGQHPVLQLD